MMTIPEKFKQIHERALGFAAQYKKAEVALLETIILVRDQKIYRFFDCTSVFEYCVQILKLDPGLVYGFTAVAKKASEVPQLKEEIKKGTLNVSTAKRITSVLTQENQSEWFKKAESLSVRKLEREVARANPKAEVIERAAYLNSKRIRLELGLDEAVMIKIRRIQDLESQKQRRSISLEEVMDKLVSTYLTKFDPIEKAKRAQVRGKLQRPEIVTNVPSPQYLSPSLTCDSKNPSTWPAYALVTRNAIL